MTDHNLKIDDKICLTHSIGIFSYHQELSAFLDSLAVLPEAFVCASDYSNTDGQITTANVKTSLLGKRLSVQIVYRMEHPDAPYELTFINPEIIYRDSILY